MIRIVALNEDSDGEESNCDEITVTKEAEETIAVSEYIRALEFRSQKRNDHALTLLNELLQTRVLNEITTDDKNDKLLCIRYNCHKNIGLIYEERGENILALEHFMQAMELDDSEVHIMHRLGRLSLKLKEYGLAHHAFQKCLKRNQNHWPSIDGVLQVLCLTENIMGAYGWALKYHLKDNTYERALDVLTEITEKFSGMIPFFQTVWKTPFLVPTGRICGDKKSVFPEPNPEIIVEDTKMVKPNLDSFRVNSLSWLSIGTYISSVYKHLEETKQSIIFILTIDDMLKSKCEEKLESPVEIVQSEHSSDTEITAAEATANDMENNTLPTDDQKAEETLQDDDIIFVAPSVETASCTPQDGDASVDDSMECKSDTDVTKPKSRRRCSDLSFLEQWGWHKNRRYSARKKSQQDRQETDTTVNGFLRRTFAKYFTETFDSESPFLLEAKPKEKSENKNEEVSDSCKNHTSYDDFQRSTETDFQNFLKELNSQNFDLILIIFLWLKYVSKYWDLFVTDEMKDIYHELYSYYLRHYDLATWNLLPNDDFNASFRMTLMFLELDIEKEISKSDGHFKEMNAQWRMLFHHLRFNSGCAFVISDEWYERNIIRMIHMEYCWAKFENQLSRSVECLMHLEQLIQKQADEFVLKLPNMKEFTCTNLEAVISIRIDLQRKISLNNVKTLYDNNKFDDLVHILKDSLIYSTEIKNSDDTLMKIHTQFEVLLESLWNLEKYEECLIWSERCLKHAVDNLLTAPSDTFRYGEWCESVNFILIYIEELVLKDDNDILKCLNNYQSRLIQSISRILAHQLDEPFDKNNNPTHPVNIKRPWIILHQVLQRTEDSSPVKVNPKSLDTTSEAEDIEEILPPTLLTLFTAHEYLGRRQWCTRDNGQLLLYTLDVIIPILRAPCMDACREIVNEYLEQITYCLYGYPPKKARSRHIEEHEANSVDLTWKRAIQLFDLYRPENLPEFNSYKLESITADMEQLLLKILPQIPKEFDPSSLTTSIRTFINGDEDTLPDECNLLPQRISCIYYLLADYYFKSRDFSKTVKYYVLDLTCKPTRFDSWAGIALSKASKLDTKLNSFNSFELNDFLVNCENTIRCFEQCIKLNGEQTLLWIEYGSFAYSIHSFCSRDLKHSSDTLSMEQFAFVETRKEKYLNTAYNCFSVADKCSKNEPNDDDDDSESHDDKWLNQYMLGKIAEKRKEHPKIYLDHYLMAANYLYENNATYPIKLNHSNPTTLSIEALEIYYRTNSAIIKYIEQHQEVPREIGNYFLQVLKNLASSPFAFNKAKIDDNSLNAFKRKLADKAESAAQLKRLKENEASDSNQTQVADPVSVINVSEPVTVVEDVIIESSNAVPVVSKSSRPPTPTVVVGEGEKDVSPSRRGSQESSATTTTTSATGTTSSTSSSSGSDSSSSDSSSSESESGSSSDDENEKPDSNTPFTLSEMEPIYKSCIRNLEECITRFPEHYKSIYRLVNHYLNAPEKYRDIEKCQQLLLGTYTTALETQINGLFAERKNNNFFNGIWRIPTSEIDRPGSFSSHMVKCVSILIDVLHKSDNHKLLIDIALQLRRNPDNDKRYIKDNDRLDLYQQSISFCVQSMRDTLKRNVDKRNDPEILNLLIDIYKSHKKCLKHMNQKEPIFTQLLVDVYKAYIQNKVTKIPENMNMCDLAIKLCLQEIAARKNQEKVGNIVTAQPSLPGLPAFIDLATSAKVTTTVTTVTTTKSVQTPGGNARVRGRPVGSKNTTVPIPSVGLNVPMNALDSSSMSALISMYGGGSSVATQMAKDPVKFQNLVSEYFKLLGGPTLAGMPAVLPNLVSPSMGPIANPIMQAQASRNTPPPSTSSQKIPQFDIKNLIASAASQVSKSANSQSQPTSTTINIGSGELTITPTLTKAKEIRSSSPKVSSTTNLGAASVSVTKVPVKSPSISVKSLSDLTGKNAPSPKLPPLPDLPKSLTITPSFTTEKPQSSKTSQISMMPDKPKMSTGKMKSTSKKQSSSPYSRNTTSLTLPPMGGIPSIPTSQYNPSSALAQQYAGMGNFNMDNFNSQAALLATYADLLKTMGNTVSPSLLAQMSQLPQLSQFQMLGQKKPYTKKPKTTKVQNKFPITTAQLPSTAVSAMNMMSQSHMQPSTSKTKIPSFTPPFPVKSMTSMNAAHSQNPSPGIAMPNITPPMHLQTSPTKTLQQKLAEKQKLNQINESASSASRQPNASTSSKRKNVDVIILD